MKPRVLAIAAFAALLAAPPALANPPVTPENTADRIIPIHEGTRHINVTDGETVVLDINGQLLTWYVDAVNMYPFDLGRVVPDAQGVMVFVEPDPKYEGG